ncbi:MAG: hypothetical protein AAF623_14210 [Planctomycetota bacterium]
MLLVLAGLLHVPVWWIDGGSWEGSVSWRKPILFGISTGMTLCSLGWISANLKPSKFHSWMGVVVSSALVIEVFLITMQQWRQVPSHFNQSSSFNAGVDNVMLAMIVIATVGIVYFGVRCFSGKLTLPSDQRLAVQCGMIFLVVSCMIGFVISHFGYQQVSAGLSPEKYGQQGVTKFPHGAAIHALQYLPIGAWILSYFRVEEMDRTTSVAAWSLSMACFLAFACHQTLLGLGRFDWTPTGMVLMALSALLFIYPVRFLIPNFEPAIYNSQASQK